MTTENSTDQLTTHFTQMLDQQSARKENTRFKISVTRLGNLLDFGQLFKAFGNN